MEQLPADRWKKRLKFYFHWSKEYDLKHNILFWLLSYLRAWGELVDAVVNILTLGGIHLYLGTDILFKLMIIEQGYLIKLRKEKGKELE